jgi:hypothetical protein
MLSKVVTLAFGLAILTFVVSPLRAQAMGATLTGTITEPSWFPMPKSVKSVATGQATKTQANSAGIYNFPNLVPGDYVTLVAAADTQWVLDQSTHVEMTWPAP